MSEETKVIRVKVVDFDMPISSMIWITFKWFVAMLLGSVLITTIGGIILFIIIIAAVAR